MSTVAPVPVEALAAVPATRLFIGFEHALFLREDFDVHGALGGPMAIADARLHSRDIDGRGRLCLPAHAADLEGDRSQNGGGRSALRSRTSRDEKLTLRGADGDRQAVGARLTTLDDSELGASDDDPAGNAPSPFLEEMPESFLFLVDRGGSSEGDDEILVQVESRALGVFRKDEKGRRAETRLAETLAGCALGSEPHRAVQGGVVRVADLGDQEQKVLSRAECREQRDDIAPLVDGAVRYAEVGEPPHDEVHAQFLGVARRRDLVEQDGVRDDAVDVKPDIRLLQLPQHAPGPSAAEQPANDARDASEESRTRPSVGFSCCLQCTGRAGSGQARVRIDR